MTVMLATLCLNEMEWLNKLWLQHKDWPGLIDWVFVEAADRTYAETNPSMVSKDGLSVDGTSDFLSDLEKRDCRVHYVRHGFSDHTDPARCKIAARQQYMNVAEKVSHPDLLIQLDADEFYTKVDQTLVNEVMVRHSDYLCFTLPKREIWRPPSVKDRPLFDTEVVGGFWNIACCHWWNWRSEMAYRDCHITPSTADGRPTNDRLLQLHLEPNMPQMIHLGFASARRTRLAKNKYYAERGEMADPQRRWYVQSRSAWDTWRPGFDLPNDAKVIPYVGPIPEVFR